MCIILDSTFFNVTRCKFDRCSNASSSNTGTGTKIDVAENTVDRWRPDKSDECTVSDNIHIELNRLVGTWRIQFWRVTVNSESLWRN